jgi:SAM-dependent methyltransferase
VEYEKIAPMSNWFNSPLGQFILESEMDKCGTLVPSGYYACSLQLGMPGVNFLDAVEVQSRFMVDVRVQDQSAMDTGSYQPLAGCHYTVSSSSALPFPERSQNIVVLPHTLDFCGNPHEVLRQVNQILQPEGCLVISGFNRASFYGGLRPFLKGRNNLPWSGRFYSVGRVQDWLALLGYDLVGAGMIAYQPPLQSQKWREKLDFMEKAGNRWWPGLGGVYLIVGRKREMAVTPRSQPLKTWQRLIPAIAQPASQRAAKMGMKLVVDNQ